jgi:hypothetical protein
MEKMQTSFRNFGWGLAGALMATGALTGGAMAAPESEQFELRADPHAFAEQIKCLEGDSINGCQGGEHIKKSDIVRLSEVLRTAKRITPDGEKCGTDDHPKSGFCWNKQDNQNPEWIPQGLTASWDAYEKGTYDGRTVVAAGWYHKGKNKEDGNRLTFSDRSKKTYNFVVLAKPTKVPGPTDPGADIEALDGVHSGGIAWVGHYLYVADTGKGLRVFDLNHIWEADTESRDYKVANGKVSARGYRYVLPQVGQYDYAQAGKACQGSASPIHSSVAVDRKTKSLVTGEYCGPKGDGKGRIVRWPLDTKDGELTGLLKSTDGKDGKVVGSRNWYQSRSAGMQGVVTHGDDVWLSITPIKDGKEKPASWEKHTLAGLKTGDVLHRVHASEMCTQGSEDLTFESDDRVWTLTEFNDERQVFPIQRSSRKDCTPS